MKRFILIALFLSIFIMESKAEQISSVESSGSWIYLYNAQGKRYKSMSVSTVGEVKGFSSSFFVSQNGSWIYIWDADGKKIGTMSKSTVGDVIGVADDTFTSKNGSWIYTWSKEGKKINTRSAGHS